MFLPFFSVAILLWLGKDTRTGSRNAISIPGKWYFAAQLDNQQTLPGSERV